MRLTRLLVVACLIVAYGSQSADADFITTFTDRMAFENATGQLTVEDFTDTSHFPITTGILNSETNLPGIGILPGDIQPGVTYSTPIGTGNFFNIDAGGGYDGGFLDGFNPSDREVTIDFHGIDPSVPRSVSAFGFDTGGLGSTSFDVLIQFDNGPDQLFTNVYPAAISFFGFQSDQSDISSVVIGNEGGFFGFDFDNFTFSTVPEPNSAIFCGIAGLVLMVKRRRQVA